MNGLTARGDMGAGGLRCDWCGRETSANYVHGHIQCVHCHRNIAPCCEGEVCEPVGGIDGGTGGQK